MKFYFTIIFGLISHSIFSQNLDSLENVYRKTADKETRVSLAMELMNAFATQDKSDKVETYASKVIEDAEKLGDKSILYDTYWSLGEFFLSRQYEKGDSLMNYSLNYATKPSEKAIVYGYRFDTYFRKGKVDKGYENLEIMRDYIGIDTLSVEMAEYYFLMSNYMGAKKKIFDNLKYLKKAKEVFEYNNKEHHKVNHNLSLVYEKLQAYDKMLEIQAGLLKYTIDNNIPFSELFCYYSIMTAQFGLKDYEATKVTCQKAIRLKEEHNFSTAFGYTYFILGKVYTETKQLDSAEFYFNKGVEISEIQDEQSQLINNYIGLTNLYVEQKKWKNAKEYGEAASNIINYVDVNLNYLLAQIYEQEGNISKAHEMLKKNWEYHLQEEEEKTEFKTITALLDEKYEQEKEQETLVFQQKLARQKQYYIGSILLLGLLVAFGVIILQRRNNRQLKSLNIMLQKSNSQLQQVNYELRTFNYIASHDIKEPIRNIGSYASLIRRKLPDDLKEKLEEYFEFIKRNTAQLYILIEDFAYYSTLSKDDNIKKEVVDLNLLIHNVIDNLQESVVKYKGEVLVNNLPIINSSNAFLFTTLKNLIENGLKYNQSENPTVNIDYQKIADAHQIIVSDNGIGIEKQYHDKIFEMFKRLHNRGEYEGSGIGLAIVKLCAEKLGGTVQLESEEEKGSRFVIQLPI